MPAYSIDVRREINNEQEPIRQRPSFGDTGDTWHCGECSTFYTRDEIMDVYSQRGLSWRPIRVDAREYGWGCPRITCDGVAHRHDHRGYRSGA